MNLGRFGSVNNVCKLLQFLGDFVPRPPTGDSLLEPTENFRPTGLFGYGPQNENSWRRYCINTQSS